MTKLKERTISFINDTADQDEKLERIIKTLNSSASQDKNDTTAHQSLNNNDDVKKKARAMLSEWGLLHIKLHTMIFGEIVLSDSHLYNNFFLHELGNDDYKAFADCMSENGIVEARCRHKEGQLNSVEGLFFKKYDIRSYWSEDFQKLILEAGEILKCSGKSAKTIDEYLKLLSNPGIMGSEYFNSVRNEFNEFCDKMSRTDYLIKQLDKYKRIELWKDNVIDGLFLTKKRTLLRSIEDLREEEADDEVIDELKDKIKTDTTYDGSGLGTICKKIGTSKALNFFRRDLHRDIFYTGAARQHECRYIQQRLPYTENENIGNTIYLSPRQRFELSSMPWKDFSERCRKSKFNAARAYIINEFSSPSVNRGKIRGKFKEMLWSSFGIKSCSDTTVSTEGNNSEIESVSAFGLDNKDNIMYIINEEVSTVSTEKDAIRICFK